ncbi:phage baseplate assembly protein V [Rubrimonas sp.]|uniref:phage baseplate assembly protein V n=1 Tax=Rubrimonas sp. TaxID=2036015 RepID=UPI002FDCC80B
MKPETPAWTSGIHLAQVVDDSDPQSLNRIRVHLIGLGLTLWAPVLIPGGGAGYGVALGPKTGETVAVAFAGGDPAHPLVLGALWSGARARPEAAGKPDESYAIVSPGGAVIRVEETGDAGEPSIVIAANHRTRIRIEAGGGGNVRIDHANGSISVDPDGVTVNSDAAVSVSSPTVKISASTVTIEAAVIKATGVVQCETLVANTVVAASYTPGSGNIL